MLPSFCPDPSAGDFVLTPSTEAPSVGRLGDDVEGRVARTDGSVITLEELAARDGGGGGILADVCLIIDCEVATGG